MIIRIHVFWTFVFENLLIHASNCCKFAQISLSNKLMIGPRLALPIWLKLSYHSDIKYKLTYNIDTLTGDSVSTCQHAGVFHNRAHWSNGANRVSLFYRLVCLPVFTLYFFVCLLVLLSYFSYFACKRQGDNLKTAKFIYPYCLDLKHVFSLSYCNILCKCIKSE